MVPHTSMMEVHGILWNPMESMGFQTVTIMEFYGIPWNSMESHGILWNPLDSIGFHRIP
jgi:hypothetical protein